jgi:hypothetical protein
LSHECRKLITDLPMTHSFQNQPASSSSEIAIPYLEAPDFSSRDEARAFDRTAFASNPKLRRFLRRCSPGELSPGEYETIYGPQQQLFMLVIKVFAGFRVSSPFGCAATVTPEEFCAAFQASPGIQEIVRSLEGTNVNY